jgi:hypothetical protein
MDPAHAVARLICATGTRLTQRPLETVAAPVAPPDSRGDALAHRIDQVKWSVSWVGSVTTSRNAFGRGTAEKLV